MNPRPAPLLLLGLTLILAGACARADSEPAGGGIAPPNGLLVALSQFEVSPAGRVLPKPKAALLEILVPRDGSWKVIQLEDPESNVFHKAMVFDPGVGGPGILTLGGTQAALKLWRKGPQGLVAETLWQEDFGGKFSRMREAEVWVDSGPLD